MRTENDVRRQLVLVEDDLAYWKARLSKERDPAQRRIQSNTVLAIEGQKEMLEWVLEVSNGL